MHPLKHIYATVSYVFCLCMHIIIFALFTNSAIGIHGLLQPKNLWPVSRWRYFRRECVGSLAGKSWCNGEKTTGLILSGGAPGKFNSSTRKIYHTKRKWIVFQPSFLRGELLNFEGVILVKFFHFFFQMVDVFFRWG